MPRRKLCSTWNKPNRTNTSPNIFDVRQVFKGSKCVWYSQSEYTSLGNLLTYPNIANAVQERSLRLHGIWQYIGQGQLTSFDPASRQFRNVLEGDPRQIWQVRAKTSTVLGQYLQKISAWKASASTTQKIADIAHMNSSYTSSLGTMNWWHRHNGATFFKTWNNRLISITLISTPMSNV